MAAARHASPPRLIIALDGLDRRALDDLLARLDPAMCRVKVGKELFTRHGPALVESLQGRGFDVFLDLKYHDIPNTVAAACRAAASLGVWMVNVHALGGRRMLEAARAAIDHGEAKPWLVAVTLLTSHAADDLAELGIGEAPAAIVQRLAGIAAEAGCDGVVCSAEEAEALRGAHGPEFVLVTPGIRPANSPADDQRRLVTPDRARAAGADYLVVGRPVTRSNDPAQALRGLAAEAHE